LAIALGLALGDAGWKSPVGEVSLLPFEERKLKPKSFNVFLASTVGVVAILFFVVHLMVLGPVQQTVIRKIALAEEPLKAYGEIANQSFRDLEGRRAALAPKLAMLEAFDQSRIPLPDLLTSAVKAMPESMWLKQLEIFTAQKAAPGTRSFSFVGYCYLNNPEQEVKEINRWAQMLGQDPVFSKWFPRVTLEEAKQERVMGRMATKFIVLSEKK
jgi:Tfp pilus assembly protein PilN